MSLQVEHCSAPAPDEPPRHEQRPDPRVTAVMEVIAGTPVSQVADALGVESSLVSRWASAFVDAGTARLTNRPEPELARQRDRFLAAFAHELRTPLTVAQGWTTMLADGDLSPEAAVATAARVDAALSTLRQRIQEVEYLTAVSLGRLRVTPADVALPDLLDLGDPTAPAPRLAPELGALVLHTDAALCRRVVAELWGAAAMSPAPRSRRVEVRVAAPWVEIRVVREAEPISPRVLETLFDPFEGNDDATGVTLGLYLARALSVALGGTLGLTQDDDRAVFSLRIPLTPRRTP